MWQGTTETHKKRKATTLTNNLSIHELTPDHVAALRWFYASLPDWLVKWFEPFPEQSDRKITEHLQNALEGKAISLGLCEPDGTIVGHAFVMNTRDDSPVFGIGLQEPLIGSGWGRRLTSAVLSEADVRGVPRITLTVFKENNRARQLYESFGFTAVGDHQCRTPGDSIAMERFRGGAAAGMHHALLQLLNGHRPDRTVWTADLSYWIAGRKQDGSADPAWDTEEGYLQFHRDLGVMPYYFYKKFWVGEPVFHSSVTFEHENSDGRTVRTMQTPRGCLREESEFMPESCCQAVVKHMVETEDDLDVMLYALEHRHLAPANLDDYSERRRLWARYEGLPCLGLPRSPLPAFAYEWAGLQNTVMLMMDCPEKVERALTLMTEQEAPVIDAVCDAAPPLVHFPDNLSSENLTGYYDQHMRDRHRARVDKLHAAGVKAAVHLDGTVRGLLPKLAANGFDAVEALTPHPAGDITVDQMDELTAEHDVVLWGGAPGTMFAKPYHWPDMEAHLEHVLDTWKHRRFVLGVADQVPPDGNIEFCQKIADML